MMKKNSHPELKLWTPAYVASIYSLDHQSRYQRFPHINISSIQNYQGLILAGHFFCFGRFVPSTGIFRSTALWELYASGLGGPMSTYLQLVQGSWVRTLSVNFNNFSCWHPWETRFKSGFHSSFWDFICGIWKWGMASSFWNHVIQISNRQVHFQDIYSQLWIVKSLLKTFTSYNQILTSEEQLCMFSMDSNIWYWLDPNLQCCWIGLFMFDGEE